MQREKVVKNIKNPHTDHGCGTSFGEVWGQKRFLGEVLTDYSAASCPSVIRAADSAAAAASLAAASLAAATP